jgi:hypothetical protein
MRCFRGHSRVSNLQREEDGGVFLEQWTVLNDEANSSCEQMRIHCCSMRGFVRKLHGAGSVFGALGSRRKE